VHERGAGQSWHHAKGSSQPAQSFGGQQSLQRSSSHWKHQPISRHALQKKSLHWLQIEEKPRPLRSQSVQKRPLHAMQVPMGGVQSPQVIMSHMSLKDLVAAGGRGLVLHLRVLICHAVLTIGTLVLD
jgi:hypothetical protein